MKDEGKEARTLFLPFYLFTFNIIKGMKDEGKEAECSFYLFTLLPFYLFTFKKNYAKR